MKKIIIQRKITIKETFEFIEEEEVIGVEKKQASWLKEFIYGGIAAFWQILILSLKKHFNL